MNFKGQPVEGQRGRPMRRSRPSRPIEDKRCYEYGMLGHLSYDCPKLQVQGKFANVTRNNQPSYDEPGEGSSDESNIEEFLKGVMKRMNMKLRCRLSWQEDKENDRKGRKHEKPGEEEKKEPLRRNPPPRYDRQ